MFESIEPEKISTWRRITTLVVSVLLHVTVILVLVVLPLMYYNVLPQPEVLTYLIAPPPPPPSLPPPPPPPTRIPAPGHPREEVISKFTTPTEIPKSIPPSNEPIVLDLPEIADGVPGGQVEGVPGGVVGGVPSGIAGMILSPVHVAPPPPPPREPAKPMVPLVVSELQEQSKLIRMIQPTYPLLAKQARIQGVVRLHVVVDEKGNVIEADVMSGHPALEDAAVAAVKQWKYSPTILDGSPTKVTTIVSVVFTLQS